MRITVYVLGQGAVYEGEHNTVHVGEDARCKGIRIAWVRPFSDWLIVGVWGPLKVLVADSSGTLWLEGTGVCDTQVVWKEEPNGQSG